jgi:starvation-inducible outer membrane lipoprotein
MNISRSQTKGKTLASYIGIFLVLFFVLLSGCVKVSVSCKVNNIDEIASAVEDCKEQPNMAISKEF